MTAYCMSGPSHHMPIPSPTAEGKPRTAAAGSTVVTTPGTVRWDDLSMAIGGLDRPGQTPAVRVFRPQACLCCLAPLTRTGTDPAGDRWVAWVASACHAGTRARLSNTGVSRILRQKGPSGISRPSERSRGWGRQIEADIVRVGPSKAVSGCRTLSKRIAGGWRASRGPW